MITTHNSNNPLSNLFHKSHLPVIESVTRPVKHVVINLFKKVISQCAWHERPPACNKQLLYINSYKTERQIHPVLKPLSIISKFVQVYLALLKITDVNGKQ